MLVYASPVFGVVTEVDSDTMSPALVEGTTVVIDNTYFWALDPFRGQIVWLDGDDERTFRRIIGQPGDTVALQDGRLILNDTAIDEPYARGTGPDQPPLTLAGGDYFVLADDRTQPDSRVWGPIPADRVYGIASIIRAANGSFVPVVHEQIWRQLPKHQ